MEKGTEKLIGNAAHIVRASMLTYLRQYHELPERIVFNPYGLKVFVDSLTWPESLHFKAKAAAGFGAEWVFYDVLVKCIRSDQPPYFVGSDGRVEEL